MDVMNTEAYERTIVQDNRATVKNEGFEKHGEDLNAPVIVSRTAMTNLIAPEFVEILYGEDEHNRAGTSKDEYKREGSKGSCTVTAWQV